MTVTRIRPRRILLSSLGCLLAWSAGCGASLEQEGGTAVGQEAVVAYQVGPGRTYAKLQDVASKLRPGDVVEVYGGATYPGGVVLSQAGTAASPIVIRGVRVDGQRPIISGSTNTIEVRADHYVLEALDITAGSTRCYFHHADDVTLRDSIVRDCPSHGVLGADTGSGSLTMDRVEITRSGSGTTRHPVYMATDEVAHPGAIFRMQHCYMHDNVGGNGVKSRAERNEIYYNWLEGAAYRELELIGPDPSGGVTAGLKREDSDVVGNVIFKRQGSNGVRIGGDGTGDTSGRYRFVNNTFILQPKSPAVIQAYDRLDSLELHNNVFYRLGGGGVQVLSDGGAIWVSGGRVVAGQNNWLPSGSSGVPSQLTGTRTGVDPGLADAARGALRPQLTSALKDTGAQAPSGPAGHAFPSPLPLPLEEPPVRAPAGPLPRASVPPIDIGAYEVETASSSDGSGTAADLSTAPADLSTVPADLSTAPADLSTAPADLASSPTDGGADAGTATGACLSARAGRAPFVSAGFPAAAGTVTLEADVTPAVGANGAVALSPKVASRWTDLAAIVLFHESGKIQVRSGGGYVGTALSWIAGTTYHVRIVASVPAHTYAAYLRPPGGAEHLLGASFAFRSEQASASFVDHVVAAADLGELAVCAWGVK